MLNLRLISGLVLGLTAGLAIADLGELQVNSYLNQNLNATIALSGLADANDYQNLRIGLADGRQFEKYAIAFNPELGNLAFQLDKVASAYLLRINSSRPIQSPILTFLLHYTLNKNDIYQQYTLFLDPISAEYHALDNNHTNSAIKHQRSKDKTKARLSLKHQPEPIKKLAPQNPALQQTTLQKPVVLKPIVLNSTILPERHALPASSFVTKTSVRVASPNSTAIVELHWWQSLEQFKYELLAMLATGLALGCGFKIRQRAKLKPSINLAHPDTTGRYPTGAATAVGFVAQVNLPEYALEHPYSPRNLCARPTTVVPLDAELIAALESLLQVDAGRDDIRCKLFELYLVAGDHNQARVLYQQLEQNLASDDPLLKVIQDCCQRYQLKPQASKLQANSRINPQNLADGLQLGVDELKVLTLLSSLRAKQQITPKLQAIIAGLIGGVALSG